MFTKRSTNLVVIRRRKVKIKISLINAGFWKISSYDFFP